MPSRTRVLGCHWSWSCCTGYAVLLEQHFLYIHCIFPSTWKPNLLYSRQNVILSPDPFSLSFFTPRLTEGIDPTSVSTFHSILTLFSPLQSDPSPQALLEITLSTVTKLYSWLFINLLSWLSQIIVTEKQIWKNLLYYLMWCLQKFVSHETFLHDVLFRSPIKITGLIWLNWDGTWL